MEWLKNNAKHKPEALYINELTYAEVYQRVTILAKKLAGKISDEKRIGIYSENSVEMLLALHALWVLKKEVLLLNRRLKAVEIEKQTTKLGVTSILTDQNGELTFEKIDNEPITEVELTWEVDPSQIAVIMNTSATSGEFKSVPIKWQQIYAHVAASGQVLGVTQADNWLVATPLFHISGLSIVLRSLYNGTRLTLLPHFNPQEISEKIGNKEVNMISLVPTMLTQLLPTLQDRRLRMVLLGGEFIPKALVQEALKKDIPIFKTYGMTENVSQVTTFDVERFPEKIDSVGQALPGVDLFIKNRDQDGIGEIWVKSPMLFDHYLGMPQRESLYFNTQDMGYLDEDSFLYVLNRRGDLIISGGENIYPKEIEDLLYQLPEVKECAIIKRPDEKWGEVPVACLVSTLSKEIVNDYLKENLANYKCPKEFIFFSALPKNASGKIDKKQLGREIK